MTTTNDQPIQITQPIHIQLPPSTLPSITITQPVTITCSTGAAPEGCTGQSANAPQATSASDSEARKELFSNYTEYNKTLRTWFVTVGVGAPVLFVTNKDLVEKMKAADVLSMIIILFLTGCAAQILIAIINKTSSWYSYESCCDENIDAGWFRNSMKWIGSHFVIDVLFDLFSAGVFAYAIYVIASTALK